MAVASYRPSFGSSSKRTAWPTSIVRVPSAIWVQWNGERPAVVAGDGAEAAGLVEVGHAAVHQWMILEMGSSRMPVAPASFRAGIRTLIWFLGTTVSMA